MSTFFAFIAHLSPISWACIGVAWLLISFALGTFTGLGMALADRRDARRRVQAAAPDETWLSIWPTDASDDDEIALRFSQILAAEGLS